MLIYRHEHLYVKAFIVVLFTNKKIKGNDFFENRRMDKQIVAFI